MSTGKKKVPVPPVEGIDADEWLALVESGRHTGSVTADEVANVLRSVELSEDVLGLVYSVLIAAKIAIEDDEPVALPRPVRRLGHRGSSDDSVNMYLNEIGRVDLLTAEEERELGQRITEGQQCTLRLQLEEVVGGERRRLERKAEDGRRAKDELIQANLRLVVSIARRYDRHDVQLLDLVQEGNIGLMRAADKYDYTKGFKFSTYATWWIRQSISRAIADQGRTIRIPSHMMEFLNQVLRAQRDLAQDLDREPSTEEIAERCGMTVERVSELQQLAASTISLDSPVGEGPDSISLGDQIGDQDAEDPIDMASMAELRRTVLVVLGDLPVRDQEILRMRFGIDCEPHTLDQVAGEFGVTRERIRQIEARTLTRLRHPHNSRRLRSFVDDI